MEALEGRTGAAEGDIAALAHNSSLALQQLAASAVKSGAKLDSLTEQLDSLEGRLGAETGVNTVQREQPPERPLLLPLPRSVPGQQGEQEPANPRPLPLANPRPLPRRSSSIPLPVSPLRTTGRRITMSSPIQTHTNAVTPGRALSPSDTMVYGDDVTRGNLNVDIQVVNENEAGDDEEEEMEEEEEDEEVEEERGDRRHSGEMESRGRRGQPINAASGFDENHAPALDNAMNTNTMTSSSSSPSSVGTPRRRSSRRFRSRSRDPLSPLHGNTSYHHPAGLAREPSLDYVDDDLEGSDDGSSSSDSGSSITQVHQDMDEIFRAPPHPNADDVNDENDQGMGRVTFTLGGPDSTGEQSLHHHDKDKDTLPMRTTAIPSDQALYHDENNDDDDACSDLNASEHDDKGSGQRITHPTVTTKIKQTRRSNKEGNVTNQGGISKLPLSNSQVPPPQLLRSSQKENNETLSYFDATRRKRYMYERYVGRTFTDTRVSGEEKGRVQQPFRSCVINGIVRLDGHAHLFFVYYDLHMNPRGPPPRSDPRYVVIPLYQHGNPQR